MQGQTYSSASKFLGAEHTIAPGDLDASFFRAKPKEGCGYHETALWVTALLENDRTFIIIRLDDVYHSSILNLESLFKT
jgi:hypothetical protein